jgi:hypothetical protein
MVEKEDKRDTVTLVPESVEKIETHGIHPAVEGDDCIDRFPVPGFDCSRDGVRREYAIRLSTQEFFGRFSVGCFTSKEEDRCHGIPACIFMKSGTALPGELSHG